MLSLGTTHRFLVDPDQIDGIYECNISGDIGCTIFLKAPSGVLSDIPRVWVDEAYEEIARKLEAPDAS